MVGTPGTVDSHRCTYANLSSRFKVRLNTITIFLHRPSPQIPEPSLDAARRCYDAAVTNINLQYQQIIRKAVPITWIFTLTLCMELNTTLWTLSYPAIRQQHPYTEVQRHIEAAMEGLTLTSDRWPGVLSALQLYRSLIQGCLQAYRSDASYVVQSPSSKATSASPNEQSPHSTYSPSSHTSYNESSKVSTPPNPHLGYIPDPPRPVSGTSGPTSAPMSAPVSGPFSDSSHNSEPVSAPTNIAHQQHQAMFSQHSSPSMVQNVPQSSLPPLTPAIQQWDMQNPFANSNWPGFGIPDDRSWLGSIGDQYSRYLHQSIFSTPQRHHSLSLQEQSELMATLESDQLPDMTPLENDSRAFYSSALT